MQLRYVTNDPNENRINVYDADSHALLQSLSTRGKGGAGGNARGVRQHDGDLLAAFRHHCRALARLAAPFNQHRPKEEVFRPKWESSGH